MPMGLEADVHAHLRQGIEELRFDGQRTTEAEAAFGRFKASLQGILAKLDTLRREQAAAD